MSLLDLVLLVCLVLAAVWTVMTVRLIRSIMGLALTSAILSVVMYRLNSPLAAVFELSVCAGLISVIFIVTVAFTQRLTRERLLVRRRERIVRFAYLPLIVIAAGLLLARYLRMPEFELPVTGAEEADVRGFLWIVRHLDLLGQIIVLVAGAFGVIVLFKEPDK